MEYTCDYVMKHKKGPFDMKITLSDKHQIDNVLEVSEEQMLTQADGRAHLTDYICNLPIYSSKDLYPGTWILGAVVMQNYYTVFDLSQDSGIIGVGVALKNPKFEPDTDDDGGGGDIIPEHIKTHGTLIAVTLIIVSFICIGVGCYYKKKKDGRDASFVFETYKQYSDFGGMKMGGNNQKVTGDKLFAKEEGINNS
jgi:hypothetical protein